MTYTYRTAGPWGSGKGANLTPAEVDGNFWQAVQDIQAKATQGVGISSFNVSGDQLTVVLTDHTLLGPYTLPTATLTFRGEWATGIQYYTNDIFTQGGATYIVLVNHTSVTPFDPNRNDGAGHNFYGILLQNPANNLPTGGLTGQALVKATGADYSTRWQTLNLADLADVLASPGPLVGDVPTWNGTVFQFEQTGAGALSTLSDVTITLGTLADGQVLTWVTADSKWENKPLGTMAHQDASAVAITGGLVTGTAVTGLPTPTNATDAATKTYVDGFASGFGSIASGYIVANISASPAAPAGESLTAILDFVLGGSTWGNMIFRGTSGYQAITPGAAGYVLSTAGPGADPAWAPISAHMNSLTDVTLTSQAAYDQLVFDGSVWRNQRPKYIVACFAPSILASNQVLLYHRFSKGVTLPPNLAAYLGHQTAGGASLAATASTTITLSKALSASPTIFTDVGTVVYGAASATNTALTTTGGAPVTFAQGDILRIRGPSAADATLSDVHITLVGYES